jgi:hypothetical protein
MGVHRYLCSLANVATFSLCLYKAVSVKFLDSQDWLLSDIDSALWLILGILVLIFQTFGIFVFKKRASH